MGSSSYYETNNNSHPFHESTEMYSMKLIVLVARIVDSWQSVKPHLNALYYEYILENSVQ